MSEDPVIAGNVSNKYETRNPVYRFLVSRFLKTVVDLAKTTNAERVLEIGCGEGKVSRLLARSGFSVRATDVSPRIIEVARGIEHSPAIRFEVKSALDLDPAADAAPLVVGIEVLEHIDDPEVALSRIAAVARPYILLSVPREPIWRVLNFARGRYMKDFGNTPGHVNHWSGTAFRRFVSQKADVIAVRNPWPWTVVLARVKGAPPL